MTRAPLFTAVSVRMGNNALVSVLLSRYHVRYSTGIRITKTYEYDTVSTDHEVQTVSSGMEELAKLLASFRIKRDINRLFPLCFIKAKPISKQGKSGYSTKAMQRIEQVEGNNYKKTWRSENAMKWGRRTTPGPVSIEE